MKNLDILLLRKLAQTKKLINFVPPADKLHLLPQFKDIYLRISLVMRPQFGFWAALQGYH